MSIKASDFRTVGRQHAQDKRRREAARAITAAEDAYDAAWIAWRDDPSPTANETALRVATDALAELDPTNFRLT